jgi:hypothetical protein
MNKIWISMFIIVVMCLVATGGFYFGVRERANSQPDKIIVRANNGAVQNDLTRIEKREVKGILETDKVGNYGQLFFINSDNNNTQMRIDLVDVPLMVKQLKSGKQKLIPKELRVSLARTTKDGTDFDYEEIGTLIFDELNHNNLQTAQFSTVLEKSLYSQTGGLVQRVVLQATKPEDENFFSEDNPNLPINVRPKPAPYFFIEI